MKVDIVNSYRGIKSFINKKRGKYVWCQFIVTRKCNLDCSYCGIVDNRIPHPNMQEMKKRIDFIKGLGITGVAFFGGEPTIYKDLIELISYTSKKGLTTQLSSNLFLTNKNYLDRLSEAGLDELRFSVDSTVPLMFSEKNLQNRYINTHGEKNTFKNNLKVLLQYKNNWKFSVNATLVLTKFNIVEVEKVLVFLKSYDIPLSIAPVQPKRPTKSFRALEFYDFQPFDVLSWEEMTIQLKRWKKDKTYKLDQPIEFFESMVSYLKSGGNWNCGAGVTSFTLDVDGQISYCSNLLKTHYDPNIRYFELKDRGKRIKLRIKADFEKRWCVKNCLSGCQFTTKFYLDSPIKLLVNLRDM